MPSSTSKNTRRFLELMGNPPRDGHYLIAPADLDWFAVFSFDPVGYVKDDEKIDADALLKSLKESDAPGNEERKRLGMAPIYTDGWHVPPHYDAGTKRLEWGMRLRDEKGGMHVNYTSRLLGRSGVMSAVLVSSPQTLTEDMKAFNAALAGYDFVAGEKYAEFKSGDRIAEYGLAALVVGGAAAAAAKAGWFKSSANSSGSSSAADLGGWALLSRSSSAGSRRETRAAAAARASSERRGNRDRGCRGALPVRLRRAARARARRSRSRAALGLSFGSQALPDSRQGCRVAQSRSRRSFQVLRTLPLFSRPVRASQAFECRSACDRRSSRLCQFVLVFVALPYLPVPRARLAVPCRSAARLR